MTMILGVLLMAVAVDLGAGELKTTPPYKEHVKALEDAAKALVTNVISMEHIPLLNDTRRHYAEIIHVVKYISEKQSQDPYPAYNEVYYEYLNTSAREGITNPQNVISEVRNLLDNVHKNTVRVKDLISSCHNTTAVCDEMIHEVIKENQDKFGVQAIVLSAAARAARPFNEMNEKFEEVSKDLNANQYVWTSPDDLRVLVGALVNLYQTLEHLEKNHLIHLTPELQARLLVNNLVLHYIRLYKTDE